MWLKPLHSLPIKEQIGDDVGLLRQLCPRAKPMMQYDLPALRLAGVGSSLAD